MKLQVVLAAVMALLAASLPAAPGRGDVPQFAHYAVAATDVARPANVVFANQAQRDYRTRIRAGAGQPANFAGEYVLSAWGCGTNCLMGAVISRKTGRVTMLPGTICCWSGDGDKLAFRRNSRLLVAAGVIDEQGAHGAHFYEFTGTRFKHLRTIAVPTETAGP